MTPTVGLALIAKDEEQRLARLLASVAGAFDQVVLVDTGSSDGTVARFEHWAAEERGRNPDFRHAIGSFQWRDDFAAARAHADTLLETDWTCWADADDEIRGAARLRELAAEAPPEVAAFVAGYAYAHDSNGNCCCFLRRERLVRRGAGTWAGRVHEAQLIDGQSLAVPPEIVEWVHHPDPERVISDRNLRILRSWVKDEPENPHVLGYLGTEYTARGRHKEALRFYRRYLKLKSTWDEPRAQVYRKLGTSLIGLGRHEEAIARAFDAAKLLPHWPDSYLTLAEAHYHLGEYEKAVYWGREVVRLGVPETLLIINPLDYSLAARVIVAGALGGLGRIDEAIAIAEEAFAIAPGIQPLADAHQRWRVIRRRESTAKTVVSLAQLLVAQDEQLKALAVLDAAPYFAQDHPQVVAARSALRERLDPLFDSDGYARHYESGGSKPEDFVADERVLALGDALPRCQFLLAGLREQAA